MSVDDDVPVPRDDVEWVELDGEAVLHDAARGTLHRLNASATAVWTACDGATSASQIVDALQRAYAGPTDAIAADVESVIHQLRELDLLAVGRWDDGPPAPA